jgi:hypothetical protein
LVVSAVKPVQESNDPDEIVPRVTVRSTYGSRPVPVVVPCKRIEAGSEPV